MGHKKGFYEKYIKRPQDFLCALLACIVLSPVLLIVAILVRVKLGTPVMFSQERPGLNGEIFKLYKFRTMTSETDENGNLLPDEQRLTSFGKKLRATSLDELPELGCILTGKMSVVGPRPLLVKYLPLYNEHQARRHEVRPGFTGYAQANGRNALSWEQKFDMDVEYVDHVTFRGDWKIIFQTVKTVLKKEGISSDTSATMEEFRGSNDMQRGLMKKLYIIGAGGFGREVAWLVERINEKAPTWDLQGFIDDNESIHGNIEDDYKVLGGCDYLEKQPKDIWCVCAVGSARVRNQIIEKVSSYKNVHFATLIDPSVMYSKRVAIGEGSIVCAGTILTVDITIGKHVIINLDCTVGHDAVLKDFITVYPSVNISGNVTVGTGSELGTGTQIIQGKNICANSIVGAGALVVKNIENAGTYIGVPAIKKDK